MNKMLQDLKANQSELKHVLESRFIEPLSALQDDLNKFQSLVEETLDLDEAGRGDFVVRPGFDEGLQGTQFDSIHYFLTDQRLTCFF